MLTHHTLVTAVASLQGFVDLGGIKLGPDDSFLSFLTLAHIFDRVVEEFILSLGGHIGYWQVQPLNFTQQDFLSHGADVSVQLIPVKRTCTIRHAEILDPVRMTTPTGDTAK